MCGQHPGPDISRPAGKLGPGTRFATSSRARPAKPDRIEQDLYPYAAGGAVTYLKPGQPIFDWKTTGGWYYAGSALKQTLVRAGLPKVAPRVSASSSSGSNLALVAGIWIPGALALAGAAVLVARRRSRS